MMFSYNESISSFGNIKLPANNKEKDYELLHYFDDQSDNESINSKKSKSKNIKQKNDKDSFISNSDNIISSSDDDSFFQNDKDNNSMIDENEKVIEKSPDGNYGKVCNNFII